jgi:hypothetical protein
MDTQVETCLVASGNTYNPSLIVLRQKGYELWLEKGENGSLWCAKKGGQSFLAYTGPELLGLVVLWDTWGQTGTSRTRTFTANSSTQWRSSSTGGPAKCLPRALAACRTNSPWHGWHDGRILFETPAQAFS